MGALAKVIADRIAFLDAVEFPENVICSHFGDHLSHANLSIQIGCRLKDEGTLLITIYDRRCTTKGFCRHGHTFEGKRYIGYSEAIHQARARSIAEALGCEIIDYWNGGDGHTGVSIELSRKCPAVVLTGIRNYGNMGSPFDLSDAAKQGFEAYRQALSGALLEA